jgi:hypothetical protein
MTEGLSTRVRRAEKTRTRVHAGRVLALVAFCLIAAACDSQKSYASLADLGSLYAGAIDRLLVVAGTISIDATSERLLQDREIAPQSIADYRKLSDLDVKRLELIDGLRKHVQLLARYFGLLKDLATSDAPDRAGKAVDGTVSSVNSLGQQLRKSDLVPAKDVFTALTKIVVSGRIRGALRAELSRRGDTIRTELKTEEELLAALSADVRHALATTKEVRESRLVIDPFVSSEPIRNYDEWMANRRAILEGDSTAGELTTAATALAKLRETFESLMSGKLEPDRISALQEDFQTMIAFTETVKK